MYISEIMTSAPKKFRCSNEKAAFKALDQLKIPYEWVENDPAFTMEECTEIDAKLGVETRKNIFLCNQKKTSFYLVVLPATKQLDTTELEKKLGLPKLSFAAENYMKEFLGCKPGSASVMGLVNDDDDYVQLYVDKEVANAEWFGCNAGTNEVHFKIKTADLLKKYLPHIYHRASIVEL